MGVGRELYGLKTDGQKSPVEDGLGPTDPERHVVALVRDLTQVLVTREDAAVNPVPIEHSELTMPAGGLRRVSDKLASEPS